MKMLTTGLAALFLAMSLTGLAAKAKPDQGGMKGMKDCPCAAMMGKSKKMDMPAMMRMMRNCPMCKGKMGKGMAGKGGMSQGQMMKMMQSCPACRQMMGKGMMNMPGMKGGMKGMKGGMDGMHGMKGMKGMPGMKGG